ncbi:hypothetical protein COCNU_06G019240 [Cocos nucifera]|uniref:Uncharacterized protein n=1 Tax=Cocos nucifera TaxID=13894 RepID=A0A8K0IDX0_COCNU|nr:hypothetical protein COCNU_06G019240 [Cocos nucifera]
MGRKASEGDWSRKPDIGDNREQDDGGEQWQVAVRRVGKWWEFARRRESLRRLMKGLKKKKTTREKTIERIQRLTYGA